jgi:transposase-like protein
LIEQGLMDKRNGKIVVSNYKIVTLQQKSEMAKKCFYCSSVSIIKYGLKIKKQIYLCKDYGIMISQLVF